MNHIYNSFVVMMCICAFRGLNLDIYMNVIIACYGDFYRTVHYCYYVKVLLNKCSIISFAYFLMYV